MVIGVLLLWLLMGVGVTQPGGGTTDIFIYDDASSASGLGYTFAEIAAAFPAAFTSLGTNKPSYRGLASIQVGDTGVGTATTTLVDTVASKVEWDNGKTLKNRATQQTSWHYNLGVKVGSGNESSGVKGTALTFGAALALGGIHAHYGCIFRQTVGAMQFITPTDGVGEMVNCLLQSESAGVAPIAVGTSAALRFGNVYNVDVSHSTTNQVVSNFNSVIAERITMGAAAPSSFIASGAAAMTAKDIVFFGSPSQSDLRWATAAAVGWAIYSPTWTGNGPKFTTGSAGNPGLASAAIEYWPWMMKVVDRTGAGVSGIPVQLTDIVGNVLVSMTTNSAGEVVFGSGLATNMVPVMDHYISAGTTYAQRHRSPYAAKVNTSDLTGYNPNYLSRTYNYYQPGYEAVTVSAGQFSGVGDIVSIEDQGGVATVWTEMVV